MIITDSRARGIWPGARFTTAALAAAMFAALGCGPGVKGQSRLPGGVFAEEGPARSPFDAEAVYRDTGLDDYLSAVRHSPVEHSSREATDRVWNTLDEQNLMEYWPLLSIELFEMGKLSGKDKPALAEVHPQWLSNSPARWLIGQHLSSLGSRFSIPALKDVVKGTDLGISVSFGDKTFVYFGDTGGKRSPLRCPNRNILRCDDAMGVSFDEDFADGMDLFIFTEHWRGESGFVPFTINGVHEFTELPQPRFGAYSTPTGAAVVAGAPFWSEGSVVAVWYGTFSRPPEGKTGVTASWVGCSPNGLKFDSCYRSAGKPVPFSGEKFIQAAPVPVSREDISRVCASDAASFLCELPDWKSSVGGVLLYGAGGLYRCSSLYLAYIPIEMFGSVHSRGGQTVPFVYYFTGSGWSTDEEEARAVIALDETKCDNVGSAREPSWCVVDRGDRCVRRGEGANAFGELSVKLIRDGLKEDGVPFLVMLSNHQGWPVLYRTASLANPGRWSEPKLTENPGYGPYIIDKSIRVENGRLHLFHVISTWGGPRGKTPYGVYTQPLRIIVDGEPVPPPWPPGKL